MLNDVDGLQLSDSDVDALTTSTDGWAAALQLAALSLRGGGDANALSSRLSGATDMIGEFLAENVLDSSGTRDDRVPAGDIDHRADLRWAGIRAGWSDARAGDARRGRAARPVPAAMDEDPNWFRYHHMFAEFLRRRLDRDRPDRVEQLHQAASEWFAEHGHLNEAVDHALASGDPIRAVDLVEQDETNLLEQSKMTTLLGIVKKLPPRLVVSRARLQLTIAWANILLQRAAPAASGAEVFRGSPGSCGPQRHNTGGPACRSRRAARSRRHVRRPGRAPSNIWSPKHCHDRTPYIRGFRGGRKYRQR